MKERGLIITSKGNSLTEHKKAWKNLIGSRGEKLVWVNQCIHEGKWGWRGRLEADRKEPSTPTFTLQAMVGHQRFSVDHDMIKFVLWKDNIDRNREGGLERKSPATPLFSALILTYVKKGKWLYILFKRHMINYRVKTTKSWLYTKDLQDSVRKKDHKQDYSKNLKSLLSSS